MEPNNRAVALFAAACAAFSGTIAAFSLYASIIALPATATIERLKLRERPDAQDSRQAMEKSLAAAGIFEPGRYYGDATIAAAGLVVQEPGRAITPNLAELVDATLTARPASPHNWVRRAAQQLARGDDVGARRSIEASMMVGRVIPGLTIPRLKVLLPLLKRRPDATLERYFDQQVAIAARIETQALAEFADGGAAEGKTQRALASDFALFAPYLDALTALRRAKAAGAGK